MALIALPSTPAAAISDVYAGVEAIGLLTGTNVDVVGIFNSALQQVCKTARPMKARVIERARVMEHPVETGIVITDHRITLPVEIELSLVASPSPPGTLASLLGTGSSSGSVKGVYQELRQLFLTGALLSVHTNTTAYPNMLIGEMPHEESTDLYGAITIGLRLKQVIFASASVAAPSQVNAPANPAQASTSQLGQAAASAVSLTPPATPIAGPNGTISLAPVKGASALGPVLSATDGGTPFGGSTSGSFLSGGTLTASQSQALLKMIGPIAPLATPTGPSPTQ